MRQSTFLLDALGEREFEGCTNGDLWNGWATPLFTFEQAQKIVAPWQEQGWAAHYNEAADAFVFSVNQDLETGESDEFETFPAVEIEGRKLHGIGAFSWIWEETADECVAGSAIAHA